jgi:hypothetical protein
MFFLVMPAKRKTKKASAQEEQTLLLRQILAELQRLNANFAAGRAGTQGMIEPDKSSYGSDDEELEEYE